MNLLIAYIPVSDCHTIQYTVHEYLPIMRPVGSKQYWCIKKYLLSVLHLTMNLLKEHIERHNVLMHTAAGWILGACPPQLNFTELEDLKSHLRSFLDSIERILLYRFIPHQQHRVSVGLRSQTHYHGFCFFHPHLTNYCHCRNLNAGYSLILNSLTSQCVLIDRWCT